MTNKRRVTEDDIYIIYNKFIHEICHIYGKCFDFGDRIAIANIGMLHAIRTYKRGISEFESYAFECIMKELHDEEYKSRKLKRSESKLSLDMNIRPYDSYATYLEFFCYESDNFTSDIQISDFIIHLPRKVQHFIILCTQGYSFFEIADLMHLPVSEVKQLKLLLCEKWNQYNRP